MHLALPQHGDQLCVPPSHKPRVAVDLQYEVLAAQQGLHLAPRPRWSCGLLAVEPQHADLLLTRDRHFEAVRVVHRVDLQAEPHKHTFRNIGLPEEFMKCVLTLWVPVADDADEYGAA